MKGVYPIEELLLPNGNINFNISTLRGSLPPLRNFSCTPQKREKKKKMREEQDTSVRVTIPLLRKRKSSAICRPQVDRKSTVTR